MVNTDGHCCATANCVSFDLERAGGLSSAAQVYLRGNNSVKQAHYWQACPAVIYISAGGILWTAKGWRSWLQWAQVSLGWVSALWSLPPHSVFQFRSFLGLTFPQLCCSIPPPQNLLHCQLPHCLSGVKSSLDDNRKCNQKHTESSANGSRCNSLLMDYLHHSTPQAAVRHLYFFPPVLI